MEKTVGNRLATGTLAGFLLICGLGAASCSRAPEPAPEPAAPIPFQIAGPLGSPGAAVLLDGDPATSWEPAPGTEADPVAFRMVLKAPGTPFQVDRLRLRGPEGGAPLSGPVKLTLGEGDSARSYSLTAVPGAWEAPLLLPEPFTAANGGPVPVRLTLPGPTADFDLGWKDQWLTYDSRRWFAPAADIEVVRIFPGEEETGAAVAVSPKDGRPAALMYREAGSRETGVHQSPAGVPGEVPRLVLSLWGAQAALSGTDLLVPDSEWVDGLGHAFLYRWETATGELRKIPLQDGEVGTPSSSGVPVWTPSGQVTVYDDQGRKGLTYDALSDAPSGSRLFRVILAPDGWSVLEIADGPTDEDASFLRYRALDGRQASWQRKVGPYTTAGFSPDGSRVWVHSQFADSSLPETIEVITPDGTPAGRVSLGETENPTGWFDLRVLLAPDNRHLAVVDIRGAVWFFNIEDGSLVRNTSGGPENFSCNRYKAAFSPDQSRLYVLPGEGSR